MIEGRQFTCGQCRAERAEPLAGEEVGPCTQCGSTLIHAFITVRSEIRFRSMLTYKGKDPSKKEPFVEGKSGSEYFRKTGRWHNREYQVDRRNRRYYEHITDEETGELVKHTDEKLSEHRGRGSAKKRPAEE